MRTVVRLLFEQRRRLDSVGLDHGELSRAHKNVLVTGEDGPWILDLESASLSRRPRNLTSLAQYLFLGGLARRVGRVLGPVDRAGLLGLLRRYKAGVSVWVGCSLAGACLVLGIFAVFPVLRLAFWPAPNQTSMQLLEHDVKFLRRDEAMIPMDH